VRSLADTSSCNRVSVLAGTDPCCIRRGSAKMIDSVPKQMVDARSAGKKCLQFPWFLPVRERRGDNWLGDWFDLQSETLRRLGGCCLLTMVRKDTTVAIAEFLLRHTYPYHPRWPKALESQLDSTRVWTWLRGAVIWRGWTLMTLLIPSASRGRRSKSIWISKRKLTCSGQGRCFSMGGRRSDRAFPLSARLMKKNLRPTMEWFYLPHPTWMGRIEWFPADFAIERRRSCGPKTRISCCGAFDSSRFACLTEVLLGYRVCADQRY